MSATPTERRVRVDALEALVAAIFERLGVPADDARFTAASLVMADREGIGSHGVMLVPMYADRLAAGSVAPRADIAVAHDGGAAVVLDARNALGQVSSRRAVALLVERAERHGLASVAVRNGFHFGTAGFWARDIARHGLVAIVMSNTRPLMPPPGAAERIVGNNPIAIALPTPDGPALVTDMAMSATAMGRIRLAESAGQAIPAGWAADADGRPTTDPSAAIKGMLLPAAGPKGFGLAVMIDLLCGGLSGGAIGGQVRPLYGDASQPYACAHWFLALDPRAFGVEADFAVRVAAMRDTIRNAKPAPGTERIYAPGDLEAARRAQNHVDCAVPDDVLAKLTACAERVGVAPASIRSVR
jgi:LDH2 family malate/lactate/ureidoglycolate dehydrogenase